VQFFELGDLRTMNWDYAADAAGMKPENTADPRKCPKCGRYVGTIQWLAPYYAEVLVHGKMLGDIVKCAGMSLLVSDRFRRAWETEALRGIEEFSPLARLRVRPARLGRRPLTYFHVAPQRFGTRVDLERSLIEYDRPITCYQCIDANAETVRQLVIDESSWTGEDLFIAWGKPGSFIVTDRVRAMRDKYGLTNMNMTPVEELLWDPLKQWTPYDHSPPYWGYTPPQAPEIDPSATN